MLLHLIDCTKLILRNLYVELCAKVEKTNTTLKKTKIVKLCHWMKLELILNQTNFSFKIYESDQNQKILKPKRANVNFKLEAPLKNKRKS
jgi:hypothetical protein